MVTALTRQAIIQRMLGHVRALGPTRLATAPPQPCGSDVTVDELAVTYPNKELIAHVAVTAIPAGATLLGVTVAVTPSPASPVTYCMGVAADSAGLPVPVSVMGASTSPSFTAATTLTGLVVLSYTRDGVAQECVLTRQFTVGG
jgi:hypothetical protein